MSNMADISEQLRKAFVHAAQSSDIEVEDRFFQQFIYKDAATKAHAFSLTINNKIALLQHCRELNSQAYERICKGYPYVWIGLAAFLAHDYETGVFFIDAAASEDAKHRQRLPPCHPILASDFLKLKKNGVNSDVDDLIAGAEERLGTLIKDYNNLAENAGELTIDSVRKYFLLPAVDQDKPSWRSLATTLISFVLEWEDRCQWLELRPDYGTAEPFFLHLLKGCLLFESLLKQKSRLKSKSTLKCFLNELHAELGIPRSLDISAPCFEDVIKDVNSAEPMTIIRIIQITGKSRNTLGHDLGWISADENKFVLEKSAYDRLVRTVGASCLHAIARLYRDHSDQGAKLGDGASR